MIKSFNDLVVYKKSKELLVELHNVTKNLPAKANFLTNQILRASNSIHANIAEGFGRSDAEFKNYLRKSIGSNNEIVSHLEDFKNLSYIDEATFNDLNKKFEVLGRQLYTLRDKWNSQK
jgi:four helix bundle protein